MSGPRCVTSLEKDAASGACVAVVTLSNAPVNALHPALLASLQVEVEKAQNNPAVKAIVIMGEGKNFSAGFDIAQFIKIQGGGGGGLPDANSILNKCVEDGPKPTVAAITGSALGGGCEVAMACNARVASATAVLGLPELQLGIIPGFGGTQRLPRLVGLQTAMMMMLTSKPLKAIEAKNKGLVDEIVHDAGALKARAMALAVAIADGKAPRVKTLEKADRIGPPIAAKAMVQMGRMQAAAAPAALKHPGLCLDAILEGAVNGPAAGLLKEKEVFEECVQSDVSKSLVHVFFAQRTTSKLKGVTNVGLKPRMAKCVGIVGGGLMGSGIATACVMSGIKVVLKEIKPEFLEAGVKRIAANLASRVKKKKMTQAKMDGMMALVEGTLSYDPFSQCDIVIEAALEDIALKQKIFADLERSCRKDCMLSTNTSTIDINIVTEKIPHVRERCLGLHFFSPAHVMKLLEIVKTEHTSAQVILDSLAFAKQIKKLPVVVGNCTGFAVNRVFFPYTMAAMMLLDMGLDPYKVDDIISKQFGMPMGPFRLSDLVGADIGMHVGANFIRDFSDRVYAAKTIPLMNAAKRLGEKTGAGFYKFDKRRKATPDREGMAQIFAASRAEAKLPQVGPKDLSPQDIMDFIFFPVVNESCRVVAEGIVDKPSDLDIAAVMSMGFPPYRGGLIKYGDLRGADVVVRQLERFAAMLPQHAGFFKPCDFLRERASSGKPLSLGVAPKAAAGAPLARM